MRNRIGAFIDRVSTGGRGFAAPGSGALMGSSSGAVEARPRFGAARLPRPLEWLYIAGGLALVYRYGWLMDDAFVYFRYIDNLLFLGNGLVFNQGEYVEGYSSPFWLILLSALRATGMDYEAAVRWIAAPAFVCFAFLLVRLNRDLSPDTGPTVNLPLAFLAFNYGVACYFTSGLETPLVQLLAVAYALYVLRPESPILTLSLAVSPLVRPELAVPLVLAGAWAWWRLERFPWRLVAASGAVTGSWMAFRITYYADLLPNPFYLKDTTWYSQGLVYLHDTLGPYYGYALIVLSVAACVFLARRGALRRPSERLVMIALALPVLLYVIRIGGDARHYRYLAFPFCLGVCAMGGVAEALVQRVARPGFRPAIVWAAGLGLALLSVSAYPPQLDRHPIRSDVAARFVNKISDAAFHRRWEILATYPTWKQALTPERLREMRNHDFRYRGVDADGPCSNFYRRMDVRGVLKMGLTQPFLARVDMVQNRPGHKLGLIPMAHDLVKLYASAPEIGPGMFRLAVEEDRAPAWVAPNLARIEVIERKIFNRHDPWENLRLSFAFPGKIEL
ncbi:MAG: hypothetical protein HRU01_11755 [Myxococcales bacterium]|nr:hypothetical protein [Myxococcales bacterium]